MTNHVQTWRLSKSFESPGGRVAYDSFGNGEPVVLVHGTPSSSYLWRGVVERLSERWEVYVYDLLGYGASQKREGQDVSIAAHTELLVELLEFWGIEYPCVAGHDIGATIVLRAHLLRGVSYRRLALVDAVAFAPSMTPTTRHMKEYREAYRTMPHHIYREIVATHLRTTVHKEMSDESLASYLTPWLGEEGQGAYLRQMAQLDEKHIAELEQHYGSIDAPALIIWGKEDRWLAPTLGQKLHDAIPHSCFQMIPEAGHFSPEDAPRVVASALDGFFAGR